MKKTVKQLQEEIELLKEQISGVHIEQSICYHWEQVAATLENIDRYGELIKMEITHGNEVGKKCYYVTTWHNTLLNKEKRQKDARYGNYYSGLERSAYRYRPPLSNRD